MQGRTGFFANRLASTRLALHTSASTMVSYWIVRAGDLTRRKIKFLNHCKLHVFGEWVDSSQSVHALRDRGTISTITA